MLIPISSQNDCMLIRGRGLDSNQQLIDGETIYILETLPGIAARALKNAVWDQSDSLLRSSSARLFFNLKLLNHKSRIDSYRDLRRIMGDRYRPRFNNFISWIDPRNMNPYGAFPMGHGSYGTTYWMAWQQGRRYHRYGNITVENGACILKIVATAPDELQQDRTQLFTRKVSQGFLWSAVTAVSSDAKHRAGRGIFQGGRRQLGAQRRPAVRLHVRSHRFLGRARRG